MGETVVEGRGARRPPPSFATARMRSKPGGQSPNPLDFFGRMSPNDIWISDDGATWTRAKGTPWNAATPDDVRYDYDTVVAPAGPGSTGDAILTFGGDQENFNFFDPTQYLNVADDVWQFALPAAP